MTDLHTIAVGDDDLDDATRDRAAAHVLGIALRRGWTVQDTADVLAMCGLTDVAVELGWAGGEAA